MAASSDILGAIAAATIRWPGWQPARTTGDEAHGPCPFCGGRDRFVIFADGGYWCRSSGSGCGKKGWLDEGEQLSPEERRLREIERRQREMERRQEEHERRLNTLERMSLEGPQAAAYHLNLDVVPGTRDWWRREGLYQEWQDFFNVGYCGRCPTDDQGRASYTIPVLDRSRLVNIRHRLVDAPNGDKYRPHLAGLGASLFNTAVLDRREAGVIIVEGEKKAMVLSQWGFPAVAIAGCRTWKQEWTPRFDYLDQLYIALDPDANESARRLAAFFPGRARLVALPCKPDDFFSVYKGKPADFRAFVQKARPCVS